MFPPRQAVLSRQRRIGLRVALAVAAGLTFNLATGEVIPFFGPVLAVQFLILGAGPLPMSKAVAFVGLVLVVGQAFIVLNGIFGDQPVQLLALLGLFFFVCFFVQARGQGGPVIFLCLVIAITVTLLDRVRDTLELEHNCHIAPSLSERRGLVVARPCGSANPRCDRGRAADGPGHRQACHPGSRQCGYTARCHDIVPD